MRKLTVAASMFLTLIVSTSYGQTFGVKAGMNFSNMLRKDNKLKYSEEYKTRIGFNLGATMEIPLSGPLLFETGLIIDTKGYRRNYTLGDTEYKIKFNTNYLDIPLHVKYLFEFNSFKPYVAAGPCLGFGISGKLITKTITSGVSAEHSEAINWGNDNDSDIRQFDAGLDFGAGVEFGSFNVNANYSLGLVNLYPNQDNGRKLKNRLFNLSLGYKFAKK